MPLQFASSGENAAHDSPPKLVPCLFVIFGATGDLMRSKLLPALFHLARQGQLPEKCHILGVAREPGLNEIQFREWMQQVLADAGLSDQQGAQRWCADCMYYQPIGEGDAADYQALAARIAEIEHAHQLPGNRVFYLALPPTVFPGTVEALGRVGLNHSAGWTRLVIEKPFGRDLTTARQLNALVHRTFDESQVYRIDHYLGKETAQNLFAFRFGNSLFESVWNREHIHNVQITVAEELGVGRRAGYYEQAGAMRDMVQSHLTQLLTLVAMEVPSAFDADNIRFEKIKVLHAIAPISADEVVLGQYAAGRLDGKELPAYRNEPGVAAQSNTETFAALRLKIENWRWQGVPFYLRTGKCLPRRVTEIVINFHNPPVALFRSLDECTPHTNVLVITLQPDEGFNLSFEVKLPGERFMLQTQRMEFRYADAFGPLPSGYETLLLEVMKGDQTLFVHADETEASWRLYTPLLQQSPAVYPYPAGSWGPVEATRLVEPTAGVWTDAARPPAR